MAVANPARPMPESSLSKPIIAASPWIVLIVLALGEYMIMLDTTIVNVAIPNIASSLQATLDQILWVINAYILTFAILLIPSGRVGGILGPKKLFLFGLALFTVSSAACGLAQSPNQLIIFRISQAIGGASLTPQTLSVITSIFPPQKRGAAFGIWGAVYGIGAASGPTLGGALTTAFSWRANFFVNVPIGAIALVLAFLIMPEMTVHRKHRLDMVGVVLVSAGLFCGIFGLVEGQRYDWGRITNLARVDLGPVHAGLISIPSLFLACAILLVAFVVWEMREEEPLLPLSLLRDRNFSAGTVVASSVTFCMIGLFLPLTIFLQTVLGLTPLQAGLTALPNPIASMLTAPLAGRIADKVNAKFMLMAGLTIYAAGVGLLLSLVTLSAQSATFIAPLFLTGMGIGLTFAPMVSMAMRSVAPTAAGAASGFMNTARQVGGALGSAVVGAVLASQLASQQKALAVTYAAGSHLSRAARNAFVAGISRASTGGLNIGKSPLASNVPSAVQTLGQTVYHHAYLNALRPALFVPIGVALGAAGLAGVMKGMRGLARPGMPAGVRPGPPAGVPAGAHPGAAGGPPMGPPPGVAAGRPEGAPAGGPPPAARPPEPVPPVALPIFAPMNASETIILPVMSPRPIDRATLLPGLRPPFLVRAGSGPQERHVLGDALHIGRLAENDIVLEDPESSRRHAAVVRQDGAYLVRDLNSANGTFVNGTRIDGDQPLHEGDHISIGNVTFIYHDDFEIARPRLVRTDGPHADQYLIRGELSIGRLDGNDIVVRDDKVSRRHAEVGIHQGHVLLRDLESLNGTRVNDDYVVGERILRDGDTLTVGDASFVYHNDFEAANPSLRDAEEGTASVP